MGASLSSRRAFMSQGPPTPPSIPEPLKDLPADVDLLTKVDNPGTLEELHKKCKEVFPVNFEGGKLIISRGISNHFQISHTISMSSISPSGYKVGATYVGTKQISPSEVYPVVLGDMDPDGNINANIIHQMTPNVRCKFVAQMATVKLQAMQLTTEYRGNTHSAALTLGTQEPLEGAGVAVAQYLQSVTPKLALGAELIYQKSNKIPGGEIAIVSGAARYTMDDAEVSGTLGMAGLHLCYYKKASEQVQVGVEMETSFRAQESVCTLGYQVQLPKADLTFKAMLDTNWTVGCVLEKRLQHLPFNLALSGMMNHPKQQFRFGCGFIVG